MATEVDMSLQEITQLLNDNASEEEKFQVRTVHSFLTYLPVQDSDLQCKTPMQDFSVLHCYNVI
jgi:hypothetical protein